MEINIQSIHFEMSDALKAFIEKKIERLARKNTFITEASITLKVVKPETANNKEALVVVYAPQREEVVADKTANSFEEAVDLAIAAIEPQLEKYKDKK